MLVHADGLLGLVEHRVAVVGVLLAGGLVGHRLSGGLLAVRNHVAEQGKLSVACREGMYGRAAGVKLTAGPCQRCR